MSIYLSGRARIVCRVRKRKEEAGSLRVVQRVKRYEEAETKAVLHANLTGNFFVQVMHVFSFFRPQDLPVTFHFLIHCNFWPWLLFLYSLVPSLIHSLFSQHFLVSTTFQAVVLLFSCPSMEERGPLNSHRANVPVLEARDNLLENSSNRR